jgi:hypothetical protein
MKPTTDEAQLRRILTTDQCVLWTTGDTERGDPSHATAGRYLAAAGHKVISGRVVLGVERQVHSYKTYANAAGRVLAVIDSVIIDKHCFHTRGIYVDVTRCRNVDVVLYRMEYLRNVVASAEDGAHEYLLGIADINRAPAQAEDVETLKRHGIQYFHLGAPMRAWAREHGLL